MAKRMSVLLCVCCLSLANSALAHEFWLEPSSFRPATAQEIGVELGVGEVFYHGIHGHRSDEDTVRFVAHGPKGPTPVGGKAGESPIGQIAFSTPGAYVVEYVDRAHFVKLAAPVFERYLAEKGLDNVIAARKQRGQTAAPGREAYSHFLKTILVVQDSGGEVRDRALGLTLEVVAESRLDARRDGDTCAFTILYHGTPMKDVLVTATPRTTPMNQLFMRTDANGRVAFRLKSPDVWMIDAVHMIEAPGDLSATVRGERVPQAAEWQSFWASLTFELFRRQ